MDTKNVIAAISLSAMVIILYSLFFAPEPRQVNKNNEHVVDFSLNALNFFQSKKDTKSHFFISSIFDLNIG